MRGEAIESWQTLRDCRLVGTGLTDRCGVEMVCRCRRIGYSGAGLEVREVGVLKEHLVFMQGGGR